MKRAYLVNSDEEAFNDARKEMYPPDSLHPMPITLAKDAYIRQLLKRIADLEAEVQRLKVRHKKDIDKTEQEINHLITFIKWLPVGMVPTYDSYKSFIQRTGTKPLISITKRNRNSKFSELIKPTIELIFVRELPKHFTEAMVLQLGKEWRIAKGRVHKILANENQFVRLPELFDVIEDKGQFFIVHAGKKIYLPAKGRLPQWSKKKWVEYIGTNPEKTVIFFKY
jgi:hypothetical protein